MNGEEIREEFDELVRDYELQNITASEQWLKGFLSCTPYGTPRTQGVTPESALQKAPTSSKDVKKSPTGKEES